ncbi:Type I restriction enzyme, specificity subunit [Clostridium perfringens]|nr:restriction endonuclease subunit S [Clostridium perfringens]SQB36300.1 Type I restriction enzyme, specificity subunit [Clostridium perfringens]
MSRNVPKLRFKGFEDEWKEKKISDTLKIRHGKDQKLVANDLGKYPILGTGGIIGKSNEFLYDKESVLIGRKGTIDRPFYMNTPFWTVDTLFYSEIKKGFCAKFLYYSFQRINWKKYSEASGVPSLSASTIESIKYILPELNEQEKIANFLSKVDSIIEKQEKKVQYWNSYKKGMMQKIFSQKIRFKDENGRNYPEWEERALKKIIIEDLYPVNKPNVAYEKLSVRSHAKGTFSSRVDDPATVAMDTLYEVKENQLIVNITFAWEHAIAIVKKEDEGKLVSHRFPTYKFNPDCYYKFYEYVIKQSSLKYKLGLASPGGAGRNRVLNKKEFLKIEVQHPCFEEQVKIANFLSNIDNIIEKENKKLEELKQWKKGLLQQLFV